MAELTTRGMAFAAFMLAGKALEKMQEKGILFEDEAKAAIQAAVDQLDRTQTDEAREAAVVLRHFYAPRS